MIHGNYLRALRVLTGLLLLAALLPGVVTLPLWIPAVLALAGLCLLFLVLPENRDWRLLLAYAGPLYVFTQLRAFTDEAPWGVRTDYVISMERWLFGGGVPTVFLQDQLRPDDGFIPLDFVASAFHWSWFLVPHIGALLVFMYRRDWFARYTAVVMGTFYIGLLGYWLIPTAPPWMAAQQGALPDVTRVMHEIGLEYGGAFYREAYSYVGDANPVGAMPSLHMAASLAVALAVLRFNWRLSLALALYGIGMGASLVYLGEHYVADLVVGAGVALLVYAAVEAVSYAQGWRPARSVHLGDLREAWARGEARVLQLLFVSRLRLTARRRLH